MHGAVRGLEVEQVGGARVRGADEREDARSRGRGALDQRLERVGAEQRVDGRRVGAQALEQRLGVDGGGMRHVPALAVGDHQQAGVSRRPDDPLERHPALRAEALEAGELRLDRDAGGRRRLDQLEAAVADRLGRGPGGRLPRREPLRRPGWIRVEAEAYLAAALGDERREPVGKRCAQLG